MRGGGRWRAEARREAFWGGGPLPSTAAAEAAAGAVVSWWWMRAGADTHRVRVGGDVAHPAVMRWHVGVSGEGGGGALGGDGGDEGGVQAAGEEDAEGRVGHETLHDGAHERVLHACQLSRLQVAPVPWLRAGPRAGAACRKITGATRFAEQIRDSHACSLGPVREDRMRVCWQMSEVGECCQSTWRGDWGVRGSVGDQRAG